MTPLDLSSSSAPVHAGLAPFDEAPGRLDVVRRQLSSEQLFAGLAEIEIRHGDTVYRLRRTALGKLILTKYGGCCGPLPACPAGPGSPVATARARHPERRLSRVRGLAFEGVAVLRRRTEVA